MQENIVVILVRPQYLGNLGSVARVMKNFGFTKLRLVDPPKNYKESEARRMSVGAFDILKNSDIFPDLSSALKDVSLALGTTSGQQRNFSPVPIREMISAVAECFRVSRCAIVFGDEVNGLTTDDLNRCHHVVTVPTNPEFSALNMAQAVGIVMYEMAQSVVSHGNSSAIGVAFSTGEQDDAVLAQLDKLLLHSDFSRTYNRSKILTEFRDFYQRAHPTEREAGLLLGALMRINQKLPPQE